jgi:hypothetical protein
MRRFGKARSRTEGWLANNRMQVTVWAITARAKSARSAPAQPAPDAERSAATNRGLPTPWPTHGANHAVSEMVGGRCIVHCILLCDLLHLLPQRTRVMGLLRRSEVRQDATERQGTDGVVAISARRRAPYCGNRKIRRGRQTPICLVYTVSEFSWGSTFSGFEWASVESRLH